MSRTILLKAKESVTAEMLRWIEKNNIFTSVSRLLSRAKNEVRYISHQGEKEKARRKRQIEGGY